MSESVRPASTAARDIGSERKRSIRPFWTSSASPSAVTNPPNAIDWTMMPGHQEVDVVEARRHDRAAEDVEEQQHEHHRLDRVARSAGPAGAGSACRLRAREDERVRDASARARSCRAPPRAVVGAASSAAWPVSVRNTSSSVGRRSAMSSIADARVVEPAHRLGDRAACARGPARCTTPSSTLGALVGHRARARRSPRSASAPSSSAHLEALAADPVLELVGGALGDHAAVVDDDDLVGEPVGLLEVLGRQQHRRAGGDAAPRSSPTCSSRLRGSRPVVGSSRNSTGGRDDERGGEVEPPPHAARVGLRGALRGVGEVEALEQLVGARARLGAAEVVELADHLEVLEAGQVLVDRGVLAGEADLRAQRVGVAHDVEARDPRAARVGLEQRGQDPHRGGLAGAVGTEQAEDGAGRARRSPRRTAPAPFRRTSRAPRRRSRDRSSEPKLASASPGMVRLVTPSRYVGATSRGSVAGVSGTVVTKQVPSGGKLATSHHRAGAAGHFRAGRTGPGAGRSSEGSAQSQRVGRGLLDRGANAGGDAGRAAVRGRRRSPRPRRRRCRGPRRRSPRPTRRRRPRRTARCSSRSAASTTSARAPRC